MGGGFTVSGIGAGDQGLPDGGTPEERWKRVLWEMRVADRTSDPDCSVRLVAVGEAEVYFLLAEAGCVAEGGFEPCVSVEVSSDEVMGADVGEMDFARLDGAPCRWYAVEVKVLDCPVAWSVVDELRKRGFLGGGDAEFGLGELLRALMLLWAKHRAEMCG